MDRRRVIFEFVDVFSIKPLATKFIHKLLLMDLLDKVNNDPECLKRVVKYDTIVPMELPKD